MEIMKNNSKILLQEHTIDTSIIVLISVCRSMFAFIPIVLHIIGIGLLWKPNTFQQNQKIYLTHVSVIEILFMLSQNVALYMKLFRADPMAYEYVSLFILCILSIPWCNLRIALTIDRYMEVRLNIKYELHMNKTVRRIMYVVSWVIGVVLFIIMSSLKYKLNINAAYIVLIFLISIYHGIVVVVCILVYTYIFIVIRKNAIKDRNTSCHTCENLRFQRQKKRMFIPFWIVASYFVFIILPDVTFKILFIQMKTDRGKSVMFPIMMFLFDCCGLADSLIYIFMNASTRKRFLQMIQWK